MAGIQPELWIDGPAAAVAFYEVAFGAVVLHRVGEGDDIVAQLAIGEAAFWVSSGGADAPRFSPAAIGGATGRTLLVVDDPDMMFAQAVTAGATVGVGLGANVLLGGFDRSIALQPVSVASSTAMSPL